MFQPLILSFLLSTTQTPDFVDVRAAVDAQAEAHGRGEVLVVFDLDNPIIATETHLGSEHWYMWQAALVAEGKPDAARTIPDLLKVQGWMYDVMPMRPVEPRIPADVQDFAKRGIKVMSVTSRGLDVRDATLRELERNGLDLAATAPGPQGGYPARYLPAVPTPKAVIFERGVLLTQGQNKGVMLKALLAKTGYEPRAIVFVDDRPHHLENVQNAFADTDIAVTTIRYVHAVPRVETFNASDKSFEKAQWCAFAAGLAASVFARTPTEALPFVPCAAK